MSNLLDNNYVVRVDTKKVIANALTIQKFLKKRNCDCVISTKSIRLSANTIGTFGEFQKFYDSSSDNIRLLLKAGKETISRNQIVHRRHSIMVTNWDELRTLPKQTRSLYLYFDFGDGREGFSIDGIPRIISTLLNIQPKYLVIASHIGCMSNKKPSQGYYKKFLLVQKVLEHHGLSADAFSLGGSDCIPFLDDFKSPIKTELRVGNAIFFGDFDKVASDMLPLYQQNVHFHARVIKGIHSKRLLCNFGYCQIEKNDVGGDDYRIVKQSSQYTIIETTLAQNDTTIAIPVNYEGLSKLSHQSNVAVLFEPR